MQIISQCGNVAQVELVLCSVKSSQMFVKLSCVSLRYMRSS